MPSSRLFCGLFGASQFSTCPAASLWVGAGSAVSPGPVCPSHLQVFSVSTSVCCVITAAVVVAWVLVWPVGLLGYSAGLVPWAFGVSGLSVGFIRICGLLRCDPRCAAIWTVRVVWMAWWVDVPTLCGVFPVAGSSSRMWCGFAGSSGASWDVHLGRRQVSILWIPSSWLSHIAFLGMLSVRVSQKNFFLKLFGVTL